MSTNLPEQKEWTPPTTWRISEKGLESLRLFMSQQQTKHGMYASVPLTCKGGECPYAHVCVAMEYGVAPVGERCTREMAAILEKMEKYTQELDIDDTKIVNLSLIKELIDCEIMIMRADSLIAGTGEIIQEVVIGVTDSGREIRQPQVNKAVEMKEKWINLRHKILNQLNSTPKDKAKIEVHAMDPSQYAAMLVRKAKEEMLIHDAEFREVSLEELEENEQS